MSIKKRRFDLGELLQIKKKGVSYKNCIKDIELMLNDITKDYLEITIEKVFSEIDLKMYTNLTISYFQKEVNIEKKI